MAPKPKHPFERFWDKVEIADKDDCWLWTGAIYLNGYGFMWGGPTYGRRHVKAHRISWEIHNGSIPEDGSVLHHCDNPPCVNPSHLYVGSRLDNARDRDRRNRGKPKQYGEHNDNAKLTEADVRKILLELQKVPRRSQAAIAADFGIKQAQVSRIMLKQTWKHLWE